jgi:hypothetical protein
MYGSESSELNSGKELESVRVAPQLLGKILSVSGGARLVLGRVWGSVRIGGGMGSCFRLLLIRVNPESTGNCFEESTPLSIMGTFSLLRAASISFLYLRTLVAAVVNIDSRI